MPLVTTADTRSAVVPLKPENIRFTILAGAITFILTVTMMMEAIVGIYAKGNTQLLVNIGAVGGLGITQLLLMLRSELSRAQSAAERQEIASKVDTAVGLTSQTAAKVDVMSNRVDGGLATTVKTVAEQVREATKAQVLDALPLPKTHEQLRDFVSSIVKDACSQMALAAAVKGGEAK